MEVITKQEEGMMKLFRGTLFEGVFEVYPYNLSDEDITHFINELMKQAVSRKLKVSHSISAWNLTTPEIMERIMTDLGELKRRGDLSQAQATIKPFMPEEKLKILKIDLTTNEMALCETGRKITAIKEVRARTGVGLKEAKDQVDAYTAAWEAQGKPIGGIQQSW